jgi:soluble P-type ATPase
MITIEIPDFGTLSVSHIVCDYNGTLAVDGMLLPGVCAAINGITEARVHVITADTFGLAQGQLAQTNCQLTVAPAQDQAQWKLEYIQSLNCHRTVCIGNGRNDRLMLQAAALGIALVQAEGASVQTLMAADVICSSIVDALELFAHPKRLVATLRS